MKRLGGGSTVAKQTMAVVFAVLAAMSLAPRLHAQGGQLLDRALAIVDGQVITLSDAETVRALGLLEEAPGDGTMEAVTQALIDRVLMLREVERYSPPEPAAATVEARLAVARSHVASPEAFAAVLAAGGMTEPRLREWIRDDYRIDSYLDQRFAAAGTPNDQEMREYYAGHRDEFERGGLTFEAASDVIRERLAAERRRDLIADWVSDLRRRTDIVVPKP